MFQKRLHLLFELCCILSVCMILVMFLLSPTSLNTKPKKYKEQSFLSSDLGRNWRKLTNLQVNILRILIVNRILIF